MANYLGLVLDLHILRRQQLCVNPLRQTCVNILPRGPNRKAKSERPRDTKHRIPNDIPKESVQEKQDQIHDIHDRQCKRRLVRAERIREEPIRASLNFHPNHDLNGLAERRGEEEV